MKRAREPSKPFFAFSAMAVARYRPASTAARRQRFEPCDQGRRIAGYRDLLEPAFCARRPAARAKPGRRADPPEARTARRWLLRLAARCARAPATRTARRTASRRHRSRRARPGRETAGDDDALQRRAPGLAPRHYPPSPSSFSGCRSRTIALARSSSTWV